MQSQKLTASQFIRRITSSVSSFNPFEEDFDLERFKDHIATETLRAKELEIGFDSYQLQKIISFFDLLHRINNEYLDKIQLLLDEINLPDFTLIEFVLKYTNFDFIKVADHQNKSESDHSRFSIENKKTITSAWGEEIKTGDVMDTGIDTANEIIRLILLYNNHSNKRKDQQALSVLKEDLFIHMMIHANILYVVKDLFDSFQYEYCEIIATEKTLRIELYPQFFHLYKKAGRERYRSHINEPFFQLGKATGDKILIPHISVQDNTISIKTNGELSENPLSGISQGALLVYYFHLNYIKIPALDGIVVNDVYKLITGIQFVFMQLLTKSKQSAESLDFEKIPIKIKKQQLVSYLVNGLKASKKAVEMCLQNLSSHPTHNLNLWETPLISYGDTYYFALSSLAGAHVVYLLQRIIDKAMPIKVQQQHFMKWVDFELGSGQSIYKFQKNGVSVEHPAFSSKDSMLRIYQMRDVTVLINVFQFNFPINSKEYGAAITAARNCGEQLNEFAAFVQTKLSEFNIDPDKPVVKILLTNYPNISGLRVDDCHVMDLTLIQNFLSTGKYERGHIVMGGGEMRVGGHVAYKYYNDEDEFNLRFPEFCLHPDPIEETLLRYKLKDVELLKGLFNIRIIAETVEELPDSAIAIQYIKRIENQLKQFYYFGKTLDKGENVKSKEYLESRLLFLLPQTFSLIAFDTSDRYLRIELTRVFEDSGLAGISYSMFLLNVLFNKVAKIPVQKDDSIRAVEINVEQAKADLMLLMIKLKEAGVTSLSESVIDHGLSDESLKGLVEFLVSVLGRMRLRSCEIDELEEHLHFLVLFGALAGGRKEYEADFYKSCLNFIDLLNYNFLYQKARDLSEELLIYTFKNGDSPAIGWLCLLKCYTIQGNVHESLIYANLLLSILEKHEKIEESLLFDSFFQIMLLYREIGEMEAFTEVFSLLKSQKVDEYDQQKLHLSYYNGFLGKEAMLSKVLPEVKTYLDANLPGILSYGQIGSLPWAAFTMNILNGIRHGRINEDAFWNATLEKLKTTIDEKTFSDLYNQFSGDIHESGKLFKEALIRLFDTRSYHDLAFEVHKLLLLANTVAEMAVTVPDYELLFLYGLVTNDQTLTFIDVEAKDKAEFRALSSNNYATDVRDYLSFIDKKLVLKQNQLLLWLFSIRERVYAIQIRAGNNYVVEELINWDVRSMSKWIGAISNFYFPDKGEYFINDQEIRYLSLLKELQLFKIHFQDEFEELLLYTDLKMGQFPFNLILRNVEDGQLNFELHEVRVKEAIKLDKMDFISYHKPVTNVVSLEWFMKNGHEVVLERKNVSLKAWTPLQDEDFVLSMTYERLRPILEDKYSCPIDINRMPETELNATVNIFLAHGGKDFEGFKTIYTRETEGFAIVKEKGIRNLFGDGTIAVVFVCHSAFVSKQLFSERLISFMQHIISLGYKAVIAPAWGLNPDIVSPWVDNFLQFLMDGQSVGTSVHQANIAISKAGYTEYIGFYAPMGWASMHVYGNPNIRIV